MSDIVERLENSLKVNPAHMLRNGDIAEAGSCIKHQRAEIERLRAALATRQTSLDQIARMRLLPDDKANRVTLHAAIEVAKLHASNQQLTPPEK